MKFRMLPLRFCNNSAIIMMPVIWVLVILVILAVGLGRRTSIDLALTQYAVAKAKSQSLAWGAVVYGLNEISSDSQDPESSRYDSMYQCGFLLMNDETPEEIFKRVALGDDFFSIGYAVDAEGEGEHFCYGFQDEESRLNLNAIHQQNYRVLSHLIMLLGFPEEVAETIASSVVDWRDEDEEIFNEPYGAESGYYSALAPGYSSKNAAFETVEELLLVRGVTQEILKALFPFVTIFPLESTHLKVNINTASRMVLKAILRATSEGLPNVPLSTADQASEKIINYRLGEDGQACTSLDRLIEKGSIGLIGLLKDEQAVFLSATNYFVETSRFLRIHVIGEASLSGILTRAEAIVDRESLSVLSWQRK